MTKWTDHFRKAVTFSYDDGIRQDVRLVTILNRYGLKCTFNVNSGLGRKDGTYPVQGVDVGRLDLAELKSLYQGHEVALHSLSHPRLPGLPVAAIEAQLIADRDNIERVFGAPVVGMAYPFGAYDDAVVAVLRAMGIRYARTVETNGRFEPQTDLLRFAPTCHHHDPRLSELIDRFLQTSSDDSMIFYVWGHSYEFDADRNWDEFEAACRRLAGRADVFYGTNAEVLLDRIEPRDAGTNIRGAH